MVFSKMKKINPVYADEFDLLFTYDNGKTRRLPSSFNRFLEPIAIFPLPEDPRYIALDEQENKLTDSEVDASRLLNADFCYQVLKIRKRLNAVLAALKKPQLSGNYLAEKDGTIMVINFDDDTNILKANDYGNPAKLRFQGTYKEEKKGPY